MDVIVGVVRVRMVVPPMGEPGFLARRVDALRVVLLIVDGEIAVLELFDFEFHSCHRRGVETGIRIEHDRFRGKIWPVLCALESV
jgi:hypothetical protein